MSGSGTAVASRFASKRSSFLVASGIFLSRIAGLIRDRVFAHYFGNSDAADAFKAAFRIPNALQNLFGEGVLSASFIPVYAALLARDEDEEARRTAGAVAALLALSTSILVLFGVLATPYLIDAIAPGFSGEKRELTIRIVRILFPGAGLFVFSAWCLGILNSHRRFFLSYTAPVIWNAAMIATLWGFGARYAQFPLAIVLSWGSVVGAALMVAIQLPVVLRLLQGFAPVVRFSSRKCPDGRAQFLSRVYQQGSRADQRVCGCAARQLAADGRGRCAGLRADVVYAAREPVRDVGVGGGTSGHVGRGGRGVSKSPKCCERASTRDCGKLHFL